MLVEIFENLIVGFVALFMLFSAIYALVDALVLCLTGDMLIERIIDWKIEHKRSE